MRFIDSLPLLLALGFTFTACAASDDADTDASTAGTEADSSATMSPSTSMSTTDGTTMSTSMSTSMSTAMTDTASDSTTDTASDSDSTAAPETDTTAADASSSGDVDDTGLDDTGVNPTPACGWDARNGYYACGFEGEDPGGQIPIACPEGLVEGDPCGEVPGQGCCDGSGNNWYCADDGGDLFLVVEQC